MSHFESYEQIGRKPTKYPDPTLTTDMLPKFFKDEIRLRRLKKSEAHLYGIGHGFFEQVLSTDFPVAERMV